MKTISFFTRLKPSVELKKFNPKVDNEIRNIGNIICYPTENKLKKAVRIFQSERGGGFGTIFLGLAAILLAFVVFINIADYSIFTYKRNAISKAMDYAVTAAAQQINKTQSIVGVANAFDEDTGEKLLEGVEIDIDMANRTFLTMFYENYKPDDLSIANNLLICATSTMDGKLRYSIKADTEQKLDGVLDNPVLIEERINQAMDQLWPDTEDNSQVYIIGNPKTNMIENGTYLFAYIKDIKITGLYLQRQISLSSFAGAKLERKL
ncbi:MAG TPA: hypothetical protein VIK78_18515 [Ruminiclostridium sp.]